jgi:hypothetical protein
MGRPLVPHFEPTGLVGFKRLLVGPRLADIGALWWQVLGREREAMRGLLATAGVDPSMPHFASHVLSWALMSPRSKTDEPTDVGAFSQPAELAEHWFGPGLA